MQSLLIGIDGGGTKTDFVLCSADGTVINRKILGASNPNDIGIDSCCKVLQQGIHRLMPTNRLEGIFAGISGGTTGQNQSQIHEFLCSRFPQVKIKNDTDAENVMASGINADKGIAVISGTGSVAFARENGILHRVGGWGYLFDESGSGYDLAKDAIRAALAEYDGIGPKTVLTELLYAEMNMPVWDALSDIYKKGKSYIASFAPLVFKAYESGDPVAESILKKSAGHLANLISHCSELYDCGNEVVLSGGIFGKSGVMLPLIKENLSRDYHFMIPSLPPVYGAVVECCKLLDISVNQNFTDNFLKSLKGFI